MTPRVVDFVWSKTTLLSVLNEPLTSANFAKLLVKEALRRWEVARKPADNITVIVIIISNEDQASNVEDQVVPSLARGQYY